MGSIIGIEAQRLFRPKKHGMEVVAFELIQEIRQLASSFSFKLFVKEDTDKCISSSDNLEVKELPSKPYPFWEQVLLPRYASKKNISLLHCSSNTAPLFCKTPLVVTIHDMIFMGKIDFGGTSYQNFGNLYRRFVVPRAAKKAKAIITVSEFAKQEIVEILGVDPSKVQVVYNGLNRLFRCCSDDTAVKDFCSKYQLPEKYLLHIGNTAARKNTAGVMKAYAAYTRKNEDALPLVVSGCKREFVKNLAESTGNSELMNKVFTPGYVNTAELPLLYSAAYIFICPSFSEGFGMPVAESMACGTPVITSNCTSLPEVAGGAALLVNPHNSNEIFLAIDRLINDNILHQSLREKGFENAKRFNWKKAAEETIKIYQQVLNNKQ